MRVLACNCLQAAVGQLDLIGKVMAFSSWANASTFLGSYPTNCNDEGPHSSLVWQPIVYLMGQSEPAVQILQYMKWAHASACAHLYSGCCGPMRTNNPNITVHEMGPFGSLKKGAFRQLWPTRPHWQGRGILIAGQCEHLSQQLSC